MRNLIYSLIIFNLIIGCTVEKDNITISGTIKGFNSEVLEYSNPVKGSSVIFFKEEIQPDSAGNFKIEIPLEEIAIIRIGFPQSTTVKLIAEPNEEYVVNFNLTQKDSEQAYNIEGDNKKVQDLYNKLEKPVHIQIAARPFLQDSLAPEIEKKINNLKQEELAPFKNLLSEATISEDIYNFIALDRQYYYTSLKGTVAFIKYLQERRQEGSFNKGIKNMWENTFNNNLLTRQDFQRSDWGYALAENYVFFKNYENVDFNEETFQKSIGDGSYNSFLLKSYDKHLPEHIVAFCKAFYFYQELMQQDYKKEFITFFENFKKDYPNNPYSPYLKPLIEDVIVFHEKAGKNFNKEIAFVEDYESKNSLDEILEEFKGKKLFIDVWATWCAPCKEEFKHNDSLKNLLKASNTNILYVSIDDEERSEKWKEMIKFYNLKGSHLRANSELNSDLRKIYDDNEIIYIPWYILVDSKGNIASKHAAKPSKLEALRNEITSLE
ncbi:TlpA family protein disulfide reductase [Autumnicola musiva]|uniref:TlpA disulfide reductase family protein n=1 Tax=Autumnicola musiva TaxID=3075589 RepID=A0ABU3D8B9_9FLAO|nr:TlpA disulfide reductase family protein [Zunongwangia sp. F117]MDT0677767.1 TlpA disulfide reductase family protein [Zunongwangia sp. F117]